MEDLITLVKKLEAFNLRPRQFLEDKDHELIPQIRYLIHQLFITQDGRLDYKNKELLETYGYKIYPIEQDSYGWLVGALATRKGSITFA
jgi:hypothetical protein